MPNRWSEARRRWRTIDPLVRLMILNWALGMLAGLACAAIILVFAAFGVRSLLWRSDVLIPGAALLCAGFAFTFGGVVCASAVMTFAADDRPQGRPGGLRLRPPIGAPRRLAPVRVAAAPGRRQA
jgi:hypothetical protein